MAVRKTSLLTLAAVAAALAVTACDPESGTAGSGGDTSATSPAETGASCTDQFDYTGDPRPNAEINSIGAETGTCPEPQGEEAAAEQGTPAEPGVECTDQINYAGDPRPNAEINSIGVETGYCPPVQR